MFASDGWKDAITFIQETGEFVCSLATWDLRHQMSLTSAPLPRGESEFAHAGLTMAPSQLVKPPRVAESPAALECKLLQIVSPAQLSGESANCHIVIGQVVGVHLDDRYVKDGRLSTADMKPIARMVTTSTPWSRAPSPSPGRRRREFRRGEEGLSQPGRKCCNVYAVTVIPGRKPKAASVK